MFKCFTDNWVLSVLCQHGPMVTFRISPLNNSLENAMTICCICFFWFVCLFFSPSDFCVTFDGSWKEKKRKDSLVRAKDCAVRVIKKYLLVQSSSKQLRKWKTTMIRECREMSAMYIYIWKKGQETNHHLRILQTIMLLWSCNDWFHWTEPLQMDQ